MKVRNVIFIFVSYCLEIRENLLYFFVLKDNEW